MAKACKGKIVFFNKNPNYSENNKYIDSWMGKKNELMNGLDDDLKKCVNRGLEVLIKNSNIEEYYQRVYRLACEPAHISDLFDFMPNPEGPIDIEQTNLSPLQSIVAIDYALHIACDLLQDGSDTYNLGLNQQISDIKIQLSKTRDSSHTDSA